MKSIELSKKICQGTSIFETRKQFKQFSTVELSKGERFTHTTTKGVHVRQVISVDFE
jgi:hypothetical protein